MIQDSTLKLAAIIWADLMHRLLYFPLWWYSVGFANAIKGSLAFVKDFDLTLGFSIWLKNLFVPMFGQHDLAGRIISFFLRLVNIIVRGLFLLIVIIMGFVFLLIWLIAPLFILYQLYNNLL